MDLAHIETNLVYTSKHINIFFDSVNRYTIQEWKHNLPVPMEEFKLELLELLCIIEKYRPKTTIWMQEGFTTVLSEEDHLWIEKNINIHAHEFGLEKLAFVVGKDLMAHMTVFDFFKKSKSVLAPKHFASKNEAMRWILDIEEIEVFKPDDFKIKYNGKTDSGSNSFIIETSSNSTEATLKSLNHILTENSFLKKNTEKYISLTKREQQVFRQYANGESIKKIADQLFVSELTARTHWRNVKKKLEIKSLSDISNYKNTFF